MNHRLATLLNREDASTAGTKVINVDLLEPITAFSIQMRGTNGSNTPTAVPAKMISLVELVDGSDVLASMTGLELEALAICETGESDYSSLQYADNAIAIAALELRFGRHLWDEQLAFDPTKFKNPQLRITHNKALGGSVPDAGALSVFAHTFDEKSISPIGFLVNREIMNYLLVASAHAYIDLPVAYPVRKLMIKSLYPNQQPWELYNKLKLYTDEQKKVIINEVNVSDLLRCYAKESNPYFTERVRSNWTTGAVTHYVTPTFDTVVMGSSALAEAAYLEAVASYGGTVSVKGSGAALGDLLINGKCPHGAFCIPLGKQDVIEDWFDTRKIGSWKLDITAGSAANAAATCEIVVQQVRSY